MAMNGGTSVSSEVWYEFLNNDNSAHPVQWTELEERLHPDETLVYRPGLEGWCTLEALLRNHSPRDAAGGSVGDGASAPAGEEGRPQHVQRGISVRYDPVTGGLSGLPEGWAGMLPEGCTRDTVPNRALPPALCPTTTPVEGLRLFDGPIVGMPFNVSKWTPAYGVPLELVERASVNGFEIPCVLLTCRKALLELGGLREEGIFRVSPDATHFHAASLQLNIEHKEVPAGGNDVHVLANLIKLWFRELPTRLLAPIPVETITNCASGAESLQLLHQFSELHKGVILWLLDLMADVANHQQHNKMSEEAISIVMAPNLYTLPEEARDEPLEQLRFGKQVAKFIVNLLRHYMSVRTRSSSQGSSEVDT